MIFTTLKAYLNKPDLKKSKSKDNDKLGKISAINISQQRANLPKEFVEIEKKIH